MRALVWIFAAGCTGSIGSNGGDDDQPPPPPVVDVQITVQDGATPQVGVRVLFQNADGSTISDVATDAAGHATADMPSGGNLTVIRTYPAAVPPATPRLPEAFTYVGVKPGDRLVLGHQTDLGGAPTTINVTVPNGTNGNVTVVTPCGTGTGAAPLVPVTVTGCPSQLPMYVVDDNQESVFATMPYSAMIDLTHQVLVGTLNETESSIHVTPGTTVNVEQRLMSGTFELYRSNPQQIDGNPQNVDLPNLQGVEDIVVATLQPQGGGTEMVANRKPFQVTPTIIDAGAGLIPYMTMPMLTSQTITWMESGTGTADAVQVTLDVKPTTGTEYLRQIIAPHGGMSLAIPQLAGADAIYNPAMADQITGGYGLVSMTGGYDAIRIHAYSVASLIEATPTGGSAALSYAGTAPGM